ncbi:MAG: oligosaccharide flippase family protein [Bacteroidota bacterium]
MYSSNSSLLGETKSRFMQPATVFMISTMLVNGGNYLYNLAIGRVLGPADFAEAGILMSLILVVSFIGMTFQMVATKFVLELDQQHQYAFRKVLSKTAQVAGISLSVLLILAAKEVSHYLNLHSTIPLYIFATCLPAYFGMSYRRGLLQGKQQFLQLAGSYQTELWIKILLTIVLILCFPHQSGIIIAAAMALSVILGMCSTRINTVTPHYTDLLPKQLSRQIIKYALFIILYEGIQIMINYGDLFIVNHYFDHEIAGLYTSLSIIGRMVYFMTWMLVMVLVPTVLQQRKSGLPYHHLMHRYMIYIATTVVLLTVSCFLRPQLIIELLFGSSFLHLAPQLWLYALATGLFALANLFLYFFIAIEQFKPVYVAALVAIGQLIAYQFYHRSIADIIHVQVVGMSILLLTMVLWYYIGRHGKPLAT